MALRKLCKDTKKRPLKALFFVEKDNDLTEGMKVKVNWQGKRVCNDILALNGKFTFHNFLKRF